MLKPLWAVLGLFLGVTAPLFIHVSDVNALDTSMLEGETKARASDCFSCHVIDHERVCPAYDEIAKRYAGQCGAIVAALVKKVKRAVPATGATCS
jgi:cytochrome c